MNLKEFVGTRLWQIVAGILFLLVLSKGCTNTKIQRVNTSIDTHEEVMQLRYDSLANEFSKLKSEVLTQKEGKDLMEETMLNFLIYEDDLDKGKISLSQIKDKIEEND